MSVIRVILFKQSNFNLANLGLTVGSYSSLSNYYIQAWAIHLTEGNTVSDKIDRTRLLVINTGTDRSASVDYTII